ncbi:hypothetical protein K1T71_001912 [Dendrolimus kikuchii]|uniref:Uncharacterized protein n=1 Tax=Dendrolimus kikuchii TaxID=765133 RepID=A0ACC1DF07_9NEOP|nr:hypothetical protein K1T71_001912 [Dendrolimus kikuchii]
MTQGNSIGEALVLHPPIMKYGKPDKTSRFSGIEVDEEVDAGSPSTGNENSPAETNQLPNENSSAETSELPMLRHSTRARQAPRYLQDYEVGGVNVV